MEKTARDAVKLIKCKREQGEDSVFDDDGDVIQFA